MTDTYTQVQEAVTAIRHRWDRTPDFGIILGTGLGGLAREIRDATVIPYPEIPHFPRSTATSHKGDLVLGTLEGRPVMAMEGRFHLYEGYTPQQITLPVRVMRAMGAKAQIVSCASGGMNPQYKPGEIVIIEDHINLMGVNPLVGPNDERLGPRFPDMCAPYDREIIELTEKVAMEEGIKVRQGVYVALVGPCLETRAEYRFLRALGADCVGMSTVPEVIVGVHCGLRNFGVTIVTDSCLPDALKPADIGEIIATANRTEPLLTRILRRVIREARL